MAARVEIRPLSAPPGRPHIAKVCRSSAVGDSKPDLNQRQGDPVEDVVLTHDKLG
jgi:hypothetical protein